jgi:dTDP-4-amino-4,6-dideoxygalactose transaminase
MSEFHAAMALESLALLDEQLGLRNTIADRYIAGLAALPGIACQEMAPGDTSTYKDFAITVDADVFGMSRDALVRVLAAEGIDTRNYFDPPVHRQQAYATWPATCLPVTDDLCSRVLSLPMFARLAPDAVDQVLECLFAAHRHADEIIGAGAAAGPGALAPMMPGA